MPETRNRSWESSPLPAWETVTTTRSPSPTSMSSASLLPMTTFCGSSPAKYSPSTMTSSIWLRARGFRPDPDEEDGVDVGGRGDHPLAQRARGERSDRGFILQVGHDPVTFGDDLLHVLGEEKTPPVDLPLPGEG